MGSRNCERTAFRMQEILAKNIFVFPINGALYILSYEHASGDDKVSQNP